LRYHARYSKYHRDRLIDITQGICSECGATHALIPSFSLPDSSHDTGDVERYLAGRAAGLSRREAGAHFLTQGREVSVLKRIERSFERCVLNWAAWFCVDIPMNQAYTALAMTVSAELGEGVLLAANRHALQRGVNAFFASRASILIFRTGNARKGIPYNLSLPRNAPVAPDSS
jgi:hypothetical protein